jgi:hypothetical protein
MRLLLIAILTGCIVACSVAIQGRIDIGDDVGTETASPCP